MANTPTFNGDQESLDRRKLAAYAAELGITAGNGVAFCYHVSPSDRFLTAYDCTGRAFAWFGFDHGSPVMMGDDEHGNFVRLAEKD